jgi:hypothetical protein
MSAVLRIALAVREADGKLLVDDAVLDVLPRTAPKLRFPGRTSAGCRPGLRGFAARRALPAFRAA